MIGISNRESSVRGSLRGIDAIRQPMIHSMLCAYPERRQTQGPSRREISRIQVYFVQYLSSSPLPYMNLMESEISLTRTKKTDTGTLAAIHDQFYPVVYRYVHFRLENQQVCEDITGEVFLRLLTAVQQKDAAIQNIKGWLLGTASHLISDHLRRRYARPTESLDDVHLASSETPEDATLNNLQHREIWAAISRLTDEQQHVLALRFTEEYSLEETAQLMGKKVGAVKVLQFRAIEALRRLLDWREKK